MAIFFNFMHFFRLNQEKIVEKERQHQHVEYLKDSQKTQISNLEQLHADNIDSTNAEWKLKFDDFQKRAKLEADLQRENFEQKMLKHRQGMCWKCFCTHLKSCFIQI